MRKIILILFVVMTALLASCRKDFDTVPSNGGLEFSKQTVYLDTIFTDISSSTYMLKVYNRSNDDISIPAVRLEKGDASKYRIMVDGMTGIDGKGKYFPNVEILAKDSLFIFIETTVDISETEGDFTYRDRILFGAGATEQAVNLVTLIQDAHFIFPNRDLNGIKEKINLAGTSGPEGEFIGHALTTTEELNWTNDKPWVVYGYAYVGPGQTLHIGEGTKVHFHDGAGIIVDQNAHIVIDGNPSIYDGEGNLVDDNEVTFEGDRLEPSFSETPGQWNGVYIFSTSGNSIDHLISKNAYFGFWLQGDGAQDFKPQISITNSQINNMVNFGILGIFANVTAENMVISNVGQSCFAGLEGGDYSLLHCSLNNNWQSTSQLTVQLDNYRTSGGIATADFPLNVSIKNSIIYNSNRVALVLDVREGTTVNTNNIAYNLIKFNDSGTGIENDPQYAFIRDELNNNQKNIDPQFTNPNGNQLYFFTTSPAASAGNPTFVGSGLDYFGQSRNNPPDLGAYNAFTPS